MKCDICGRRLDKNCKKSAYSKILCNKHYQQMLKYGHCLDTNPRTTKDLNDYEIDEANNIAKIYLYNRKSEKVSETIIDLEDLDKVIIFKWRYWKGRVYTGNKHPISIQHKILNIEPNSEFVIDHKNSNPLDNRKSNLRITTQKNNLLNRSKASNNTSGFIGMWYDNKRCKWCAEIRKDGIKCFLGRYDKKEDAIFARYIGELFLFGEFRTETNDVNIKKEIIKCSDTNKIITYVKQRILDRYNINIE